MTSPYLERSLRTEAQAHADIAAHDARVAVDNHQRQRQVDDHRDIGVRLAIMHNFYGKFISHDIAARQLRTAGLFEAEITEALGR